MSLIGHIHSLLHRVSSDQEGASLVEYALLVTLIAAVAFVAVAAFGGSLNAEYGSIADSMP